MQEAEVVGDFLFPADQQPPGSVHPRVRALDLPAASFATSMGRLDAFAVLGGKMQSVAAAAHLFFNGRANVAFVEAKMLRMIGLRLGPRDWDAVERRCQQL